MKLRHIVATCACLIAYVGGGVGLGLRRYHAVLAASRTRMSGAVCAHNSLTTCRFIPQIHEHIQWGSGFWLPLVLYLIGVPIGVIITAIFIMDEREKARAKEAREKATQYEPA